MKYQEIAAKLKEAKSVIQDKNNWTTGYLARDKMFNVCHSVKSEEACSFCTFGAMHRIVATDEQVNLMEEIFREALIKHLNSNRQYESIAEFNDTHTHEEVMEVWDKAISLAESKAE